MNIRGDNEELIAFLNSCDRERNPVRHRHRLPAQAYTSADQVYFITICTENKEHRFHDRALAESVIESLLWCRESYKWVLICYCLMPNHLHLMTLPSADRSGIRSAGARGDVPDGILEDIARFKSYTTRLWWKSGGKGALWQSSSYDHVFCYNEPIEEGAMYVLDNPVRKDIVSNWEDYPFSAIIDKWW